MPEVHFRIRWPDGSTQDCTSPSRVVEQHLCAGAIYPAAEFLRRVDAAMDAASERVRQRFGFICTAAAQQRQELEEAAVARGLADDAPVAVQAMWHDAGPSRFAPPARLDGHIDVVVIGAVRRGSLSAGRSSSEASTISCSSASAWPITGATPGGTRSAW